MAKKVWPAKVGTLPAQIVLRKKYHLAIGLEVEFKDAEPWHVGVVEQIEYDDDGIPVYVRLSYK